MKKLAFFVQQMLCGGVENALLSLVNEIKNNNEITIYVIERKGDFINRIPKGNTVEGNTYSPIYFACFLQRWH